MTLPQLHPIYQQEVSISDPSFSSFLFYHVASMVDLSSQDASASHFPGSASVPASMNFAPTASAFPGSLNSLLISETVRTFSPEQSSAILESEHHQVHHDHPPRQVYVAPRPNRFNDYSVTYDYSVIQRPSPTSLSSPGLSTFPSHPPVTSFPVVHDPGYPSSFPSYPEPASVLSSSFEMSDRSDHSSSITNTLDAIGWTGLQQASAQTTSSTLHTTDSNNDDGTRPYSENSATGPFYNWCFLQLCGVAIDVGINLAEGFSLFIDQALSLTPVSQRHSLDPADRALLVQRSALFLHGLYRPHSSSMPTSRAKIVYVCALAMTFLWFLNSRTALVNSVHSWVFITLSVILTVSKW